MKRAAFFSTAMAWAALAWAEVTPGEILIAEMNCAACHETTEPVKARLASRQAPRLGAEGVRPTPQWLRAFLDDPQKTKPGTLQPDLLHGFAPEAKAEVIEALTHFLVREQGEPAKSARGASAGVIAEGERLYHDLGCVQCHAPTRLPPGSKASDELAKLAETSVPLGPALAQKYTLAELARFLRDPLKARPAGRMPGMKLTSGEAEAIAMFLLREQVPAGQIQTLPGLHYDYYAKDLPELPEFDRLTPDETGLADTPTLKVAKKKNGFALRFRGNLTVPKDGTYKFYTDSDDGSRLYVNGKRVVDNAGIHPAQERSGELELRAGTHSFVVEYFDGGGQTALKVRWKGPGFDKQEIPAGAFSHDGQPLVPLGDAPFTVDAAKAERGRAVFAELNCAACHQDDVPAKAKPLAQLVGRQPQGCLSTKPKAGVPKFEINDRQRQVILALLQNQAPLNAPLDDEAQIRRTLTTLNCYACHTRDRRGGAEGLRRDYLASVGEVDLGEEGRIPPTLTGVGGKLQAGWLKAVLENGEKVRPYMAARMPQFGARNVAQLPALFDRADSAADAQPQPDVFAAGQADLAKHGRKLAGVGGLTCIACHDFAGNKSLGVPAVDLASTGSRLKWDWFRRYLLDPQRLRPGTRMPAFWPDGVAANKDVLGGDAEQQVAALWAYFARKNFTDLPAGLVQGQQEIVATNEAVIYRNFIEGGGSRAIGVGYPEKANLCFDANDLRLAMIWQGPFIDAAKHRTGRGAGYEKPLGTNLVKGPPGAPFALLESESAAWPAAVGKAVGYQFRGYRLDAKQRPAFRYSFHGIDVVDFPIAVPGEVDARLLRTLTLKAANAPANVYFRAAVAPKIVEKEGGFLVGENVWMKFTGSQPRIRTIDGKTELLVPVNFAAGQAVITQEITW
jgi:mono/diheme cytochrome c family protein